MPGAQFIEYEDNPRASSMGNFARGFLTEITDRANQRRNDELFRRISENYGTDASPEKIAMDVIKAEGFDPDYKRNKLNELKEYAALSTKLNKSGYEQAKLDLRNNELKARNETNRIANARLENESNKVNASNEKAKKNLPKEIASYTTKLLKESDIKLPPHHLSDLNSFVEQLVDEDKLSLTDAFRRAYDYIQARRDKIEDFNITRKPNSWLGGGVDEAKEKAFQELKSLHDEDGITNQRELRLIAEKGGWSSEEITEMLKPIFQGAGKKLRGPTKKIPNAEQAAQIPFEKQGAVSEAAGLEEILHGD